jgi:Kef-type K+ transport system membrane component KefB
MLALFIIFVATRLVGELFERLRQPAIAGQILAGILVGPQVLGWVQHNEILETLSQLGVMFLLFRVGLEIKASELFTYGRQAALIAASGVVVPFAVGWSFSVWWGLTSIESIFVGAALVATSVGITAQVLAAGGWLSERASKLILAAAIIDDVLGLLVLTAVSAIARREVHFTDLAITAALAIGFTLLVALVGSRAMRGLVPKIRRSMLTAEAEFAFSVSLMFGLAVLADVAGGAAIIGAFLAGMALSETVEERVHHLTAGAAELLVPFFLAGIGLHLTAFRDVPFTLAIVALAVASKFAACGLAAWPLGRTDALRIGVGMIPRGEVGMVVAQIALGFGVMQQSVYSAIVFMSIATTLLAPPLLRATFRARS